MYNIVNKWPDDDVEEVDKIRDHMRGTYANRTICKFRVSWTDEDHNTWDEATGLGKDAPILVAKYLIDNDLTSKPGWQDIWKTIKTAQEQKAARKQKKLLKQKRAEKEVYLKVGAENTCPHDHEDYVNKFTDQENDWKHWDGPNTHLNKNCNECGGDMLGKACEGTTAKPACCCIGRNTNFCGLCICHNCKINVLNEEGGGRQSRRRKK